MGSTFEGLTGIVRSGWILPGVMISKVMLLSSMLPGRPSMRTRSRTGHGKPSAHFAMSAPCHSPTCERKHICVM